MPVDATADDVSVVIGYSEYGGNDSYANQLDAVAAVDMDQCLLHTLLFVFVRLNDL